uniref:Uncharacterized protein n=1 Tax=Steinernema glaseri TaxID=37863 RepID=A0A1I8AVV8_9BILA
MITSIGQRGLRGRSSPRRGSTRAKQKGWHGATFPGKQLLGLWRHSSRNGEPVLQTLPGRTQTALSRLQTEVSVWRGRRGGRGCSELILLTDWSHGHPSCHQTPRQEIPLADSRRADHERAPHSLALADLLGQQRVHDKSRELEEGQRTQFFEAM